MVEFYLFMTNLGIAAQAIDIVYQLNAGDKPPEEGFSSKGGQPLDTLRIGSSKNCDVLLRSLSADCSVVAFRFQNLVLLKNTGSISILVRSRRQPPGEFSRLYPGERVVLEDVTLDYNDLISYFNAKKTLSGTQIYLTLTENGNAEIAPQRTRGTNLRLSFGLGVTVEALRTTQATLNGVVLSSGTVVEASASRTASSRMARWRSRCVICACAPRSLAASSVSKAAATPISSPTSPICSMKGTFCSPRTPMARFCCALSATTRRKPACWRCCAPHARSTSARFRCVTASHSTTGHDHTGRGPVPALPLCRPHHRGGAQHDPPDRGARTQPSLRRS
jgi:hypothetical protein